MQPEGVFFSITADTESGRLRSHVCRSDFRCVAGVEAEPPQLSGSEVKS